VGLFVSFALLSCSARLCGSEEARARFLWVARCRYATGVDQTKIWMCGTDYGRKGT